MKKLTRDELACGYVQKETTHTHWKELYCEHNHFHIRTGKQSEGYDLWETFSSNELTKARKFYQSIKLGGNK